MTNSTTVPPFEMSIPVCDTDIDLMGHVNNVVYVRWIQDVAVSHWQSAATEEELQNILWVVVRHEIDYLRPAFLKDEVLARTWVGQSDGRCFERHTELLRKADGKPFARALTRWVPVDPHKLRPCELPEHTRRRFSALSESPR